MFDFSTDWGFEHTPSPVRLSTVEWARIESCSDSKKPAEKSTEQLWRPLSGEWGWPVTMELPLPALYDYVGAIL